MSKETVAPLVGAWIEIVSNKLVTIKGSVAPLVGAWIEIQKRAGAAVEKRVAPLVGAWIEIVCDRERGNRILSLHLWERGLK